MNRNFEILNLPEDVYIDFVDKTTLRKIQKSLWDEVFPEPTILKMSEVSPERRAARKKNLEEFESKIFSFDIVFFEKSNDQPIGWIMGEQHDYETFYLRNSGFIPKFRRRKLYSLVHSALVDYLRKLGFERIVSDHLPNNKPMLILKLNEGYIINNMTLDDRFGPMVRVVKYLFEDREQFFEDRFLLPSYRGL